MAHWQSKKKVFIIESFDNNFSSNKISLIFNPNAFPFSKIFNVLNDSMPINLNIIYY